MQASLIITTYNRPDALHKVLHSVMKQTRLPDEIIIADDGSNESTKSCISEFKKFSNLRVIHSWQSNNGFRVSRSRNKAIAKAISEYIILIDGDMILHKRFIENHIYHSQTGFFLQGSRVLLDKNLSKKTLQNKKVKLSFFSKGLSNRLNSIYLGFFSKIFIKKGNKLKGIKTCNMSFFKIDCIEVNGFNNDFEGWGREDSEFVVRLFNKGINRKNIYFNIIQYHLWHPTSPKTSLKKNDEILDETINKKLAWCNNGINIFI
jgi:glycosyltransferase involved in cell wall biosynthesis